APLPGEVAVELVLLVQTAVHAQVDVVLVAERHQVVLIVVWVQGIEEIRRRIELEQSGGLRADPALGNYVVRERITGSRIINDEGLTRPGIHGLREIALQFRRGGDRGRV